MGYGGTEFTSALERFNLRHCEGMYDSRGWRDERVSHGGASVLATISGGCGGADGGSSVMLTEYSCAPQGIFVTGDAMLEGKPFKTEKKGMFKEVVSDIRNFINEHRYTIYTVTGIFLVDHFAFNGVFRDRLKAIIERMIGKVEKKIHDAVEK